MEEIDNLLGKIRKQTNSFKSSDYSVSPSMPINNIANISDVSKPSFSEITPYSENSVYKTLSSGDKISMYENFIPGTDNQERLALQQTTGEKWANGLQKFGAKTLNAVVGGTVGVLYGANSAIQDGSWSSIYDNNFSNWLNDLDTKLNYQLPNYYTKQEEQAGVFGQIGTANFWSDKFLGGLSFTTGAIISEGIWAWATGGTSLATTGARVGGKLAGLGRAGRWSTEALGEVNIIAGLVKTKNLFKALDLGKDAVNLTDDVLKARQFAVAGARTGEVLSVAGRTARSAGYEASVEALQYKKEAEEKFYSTFADLNGREPSVEEISAFEKENESTANAVFGANMAIVGTSNLIGLGHVLNIKNPVNLGISDFINKKAFGYGIDSATKQVVKGSTKQIIARNAFDYLIKPSVTEGLFEEGLQGVTNKTANKWIEHTYNPKYTNETFSQMEAFIGSLDEQYGSEKGWKDNILGMLIGVAGGSINVRGEQKAKEAELDMKASVDRTYDTKTLQGLILPHRVQTANRISAFTEEANTEEAKGNLAKSQIAKIGATTSYINSKLVLGESISDMTQEMQGALNSMTSEQWKELGVEQDQIEQEKTDRISEFKSLAQNWKTNKDYVQYMVGSKMVGEQNLEGIALEEIYGKFSKNAQVVEALTWQLTVGEQSGKIVETVKNKVGSELGTEHARTMETIEKLDQQSAKQKRRVSSLRAVAKKNRENRDRLTKEIVNLDKVEQTDGTKQRRLSLTQKLLESENKLAESLQALDGIANDINATKNYQSDLDTITINQNILTGQDLLELDENINKFKSVVEQQEQLDPQRASYLKDLMQEHVEAYSMFMQAKATQKALTSKEFKVTNIDGWVDNLFKKNKSMSENTQAWFTEAIKNYGDFKRKLISGGLENQPTAEEIKLEEELQSGEISQETLQSIADKTTLSKAEQIIYNENKEAIDELRKQNNLKTKPKSQEQINQEKIAELEQQRLAELSEVEPITVKERVEAEPIFEAVKDIKVEQELLDKKQKIQDDIISLGAVVGDSTATEVILPSKYNSKGNKYTLRDGKWQSQISTGEWVTPSKKELEEIEQKLNESPNQAKIDELNKELEDINAQLENIPTIQQEIEQEPTFTEREVPNQAQIDKINKKYDEKINTLRPKAKDLVDEYKQRIDKMFNEIYDDLIPTEDLEAQRPTKEEIEEYKNTTNRRTKRFQELKKKLQNWQLLDASSDDGYTSIVDLLDLITQLETEVEQEDTKDTVTEEEAVEDVSFGEGSNSSDEKSIPNNSTEPVVAHKIKDTTKIELSHVKARYIVEQIGGGYTITRNGKTIPNSNIDNLEAGDIVSIDGMQFSMEENYRLSFEEEDLNSRQQQLNLYVDVSQNYLNFLSVYSIFGEERIKTPSQFIDDKLNREASFNVKPGDILTLHVDDSDNWNKSKKGSTQDEFKIYLKDKDGKYVSVLKSGKTKYNSPFNEVYANIRLRAFQNWEAQGRPDKMDLGISIKVDSVLLTAPELLYSDGKFVDGDISIEETQKVILGKGFIENGEFTLDTVKAFDKSQVSKAYVGKLTKNNPNLKIPVVVFQVGENIVAFPITLKKSANPIEFDALLQGTPQEIVKKINQGIIDNRLRVNKLTFSDISIDYNGEVVLSELAQKVRETFINKTSFVSADTLADKNYKVENLVRDASIRIDLSNLEKVFSAPKIKLDLSSAKISQIRAVKYDNMNDIENALSDIALELDKHWRTNAPTLYVVNKQGDILEDVPYTNAFDNNPPIKVLSNLDAQHNVKTLRESLTNKNGKMSVNDLPSVVKKAIGLQKLKEAERLLKQYDSIKAQGTPKEEEVKNGKNNIC